MHFKLSMMPRSRRKNRKHRRKREKRRRGHGRKQKQLRSRRQELQREQQGQRKNQQKKQRERQSELVRGVQGVEEVVVEAQEVAADMGGAPVVPKVEVKARVRVGVEVEGG